MKIRIHVTKEIISSAKNCGVGICEVPMNCAVALAVRDIFPFAKVRSKYVAIFKSDSDYEYIGSIQLPTCATNFIYAFDSTVPIERANLPPISFDVDVPDDIIDGIGIHEVERILAESKTLERA